MSRRVLRRGRALASFTATMGLCLSAAAVMSGATPAQSAEPVGDCAVAYPVADLAQGDPVNGLSVTSGTTPAAFTGEILGVLDDGIAPDIDMVLVRLQSDELDRVGGIWQGMSGSPVYAADGRLIGAVAYGLSAGPSPVAGVTPFADMDTYLGSAGAPSTIKVGRGLARTIANHSDVSARQVAQGFDQLKMPLGVSGVSTQRLAQTKHSQKHAWLPKSTYAMGAAAAPGDGATEDTVIAGGNLAASLSYGDVTQAGVGTATSVCHDKVVGFGHPMSFLGETTLSLHPADAIYIQEDSLGAPFKVANLGSPVGTITDDHLTGITGTFGALPATTDVTSTVSYRNRERTGASHVTVPSATAETVFYEAVGNHDRVVDGVIPGSELLSWTVDGHEADGSTFSLPVTDRYASDYDITFDSSFDLADFTSALSAIKGITIDDVTMTSAVDDDNSTFEVKALQQKVHGTWVKVGKGTPIRARAGKSLTVRAILASSTGGKHRVPLKVTVPEKAAGSTGRIFVEGGLYNYSRNAYPSSLARAEKFVRKMIRNDQVVATLDLFKKKSGGLSSAKATSAPQKKVVFGQTRVKVRVR